MEAKKWFKYLYVKNFQVDLTNLNIINFMNAINLKQSKEKFN